MKNIKNKLGVTLIEIMVVIAIMSILTLTAFVSIGSSRIEILLEASSEFILDDIHNMHTKVLSKDIESAVFIFSLTYLKAYYFSVNYNIPELYSTKVAKNITLNTLNLASYGDLGSMNLQWANPVVEDVYYRVLDGDEIYITQKDRAGSVTVAPLNQHIRYELNIMDENAKIPVEDFILKYFSRGNISTHEDSAVTLQQIEVLSFNNIWEPINALELRIIGKYAKKKFFSGAQEYKNARLTLERGGSTFTFNL